MPEPLVGRVPRLVGTDGRAKMSKSLGTCIYLSDDAAALETSIRRRVTGSTGKNPRLRATDPGIVENNPAFLYHDAFNPSEDEVEDLKERYRTGRVSDREVKEKLLKALTDFLEPIRERRAYYEGHLDEVKEALHKGTESARRVAQDTIREVRESMWVIYY